MTAVALLVNLLLVAALALAFLSAGRLLGPRPAHEGDAELPYETGVLPFGHATRRMSVLYYRFAVLFVVFDVDLAFLLPWVWGGRGAGAASAAAVTVFLAVVAFMLAYLWRKGVLECR